MDWEASLALIIQYTDENLQREFEHATTSRSADGGTHPESPDFIISQSQDVPTQRMDPNQSCSKLVQDACIIDHLHPEHSSHSGKFIHQHPKTVNMHDRQFGRIDGGLSHDLEDTTNILEYDSECLSSRHRATLKTEPHEEEENFRRQLDSILHLCRSHSDDLERLNIGTTSINCAVHALTRKHNDFANELSTLQANSNQLDTIWEKDQAWKQLHHKRWFEVQQALTSILGQQSSVQASIHDKLSSSELLMHMRSIVKPIELKLQSSTQHQSQQISELAELTTSLSRLLDTILIKVNNIRPEQPDRRKEVKDSEHFNDSCNGIVNAWQNSTVKQIENRCDDIGAKIKKECLAYIDIESQELHASVLRQVQEITKQYMCELEKCMMGEWMQNVKNDIQSHANISINSLVERCVGLEVRLDSMPESLNAEMSSIKQRLASLQQQIQNTQKEKDDSDEVKSELHQNCCKEGELHLLKKMESIEKRLEDMMDSLPLEFFRNLNLNIKDLHLEKPDKSQLGACSAIQSAACDVEASLQTVQVQVQSSSNNEQSKRSMQFSELESLLNGENDRRLITNISVPSGSNVPRTSNVGTMGAIGDGKNKHVKNLEANTNSILSSPKKDSFSMYKYAALSESVTVPGAGNSNGQQMPKNVLHHLVPKQAAITACAFLDQDKFASDMGTEADTGRNHLPEKRKMPEVASEVAPSMPENLLSKHLANDHPLVNGLSSTSLFASDLAAQQNCNKRDITISPTAGDETHEKEAGEELTLPNNLQSQSDAKKLKSSSKTLSAAISISTLENTSRQSPQSCIPSDSITSVGCPKSQTDQFSSQGCRFCSLEMDLCDIPNHEVMCGMLPKQCSHCLKKHKAFDLMEHIKVCEYRIVPCTLKCGLKILQRDLARHLSTRCHKRSEAASVGASVMTVSNDRSKGTCEFCDERFDIMELKNHRTICNRKPSKCQFCNASISIGEAPVHEASCTQKNHQESICAHCGQNAPEAGMHLLTCSKRLIKCTRCFNQFPADQIVPHSAACPSSSSYFSNLDTKSTHKRLLSGVPPPPPYPPPRSVYNDSEKIFQENESIRGEKTQRRHRSDQDREECSAESVYDWSVDAVCLWLSQEIKYHHLVDRFRSLQCTGKKLIQLTECNLINDMGINNRLQRQCLMEAIQELKNKHNTHNSDTEDEHDADEI